MKAFHILLGAAMFAGVLALPRAASAQEGTSQIVEVRRQVTEAQALVTAAKAEMDKARARITAQFKTQNPDYAKAEADAAKAKLEIDQSKAAALTGVRAKPEYMAAVNAKAAVQTKMRTLQGQPGSDAEFNALAEQSIKHATAISQMERTAIEKDPKYNDAVARLAEANRVVEGFAAQIDQVCAVDPDYMALQAQHQQAQEAVVAANETMKQAILAERQAKADAARAKAEERKSRSKSQ